MNGIGIWIGKRRGASTNSPSYWANSDLFLFFGEVSKISGGRLNNQVTGASDYLTVGGSAGSETYQAPDTAPYKTADTDYIWIYVNSTLRTVTTAELQTYDFPRTIIKYLDSSPYTIEWIGILKPTSSVTNQMRDSFHLSIWWDNTLSSHGNLKGNRGIGKSVFTAESIPTLSSAQIADANPNKVLLTFSEALNVGSVPATSAYSVLVNAVAATVSTVEISGTLNTLTLSTTVIKGSVVTVSYTKPGSNDLKSNATAISVVSFTGGAVTNNVSKYL